ncbi:YraN family protein [Microbacterium oryzae]|uniref:YraN family protein n=1 Tax=Microbacterium oryzae TaxID=743009 RepID=UPI0025B20B80|nr:YraN family protein [Microbacterium oryzae]MDN3310548.1 YraN family protein [Microbacterium oryzae]
MARKDELGRAGEERAARYLASEGYEILDRNWRCAAGEIDIVACRGERLAVVEVKTRSGTGYGHPFEAVDARKLKRLWRLAATWAQAHPGALDRRSLHVDAVGIVGPDPRCGVLEHLEDLR